MLGGMLEGIIDLLALLGGVALVLQLFRSIGRVVLNAAQGAAAAGMAESGVRRGDLTAMNEGREAARHARRARRTNSLITFLLLLWIAVPLALGYVEEGFAIASPIWLLPWAPIRRRPAES
jgi:hypothetical protein